MEPIRLEVRQRTLFLDDRPFVFISEDGQQVEKTTTDGVVHRIQRYVNRKMRGHAREHGRAQILGALRAFNSPKEGYTQFVVVDEDHIERLAHLSGQKRDNALDEAVVKAIQAKRPVDLLAMERWARSNGLFIGLSGKNQVLGGKVRLTTEGLTTDFAPEKLVARSLLDKPEAFRGGILRLLVCDDPFVNGVTGDGAFLLKANADRDCERTVTQRIRRSLEYDAHDAPRGQAYYESEFVRKIARHDTEILDVREDGDLVWLEKKEAARIDTGAKLVHELGFKGTAIIVDELPEHIRRQWPQVDGVVNASCIKSNALLSGLSQECLTGDFERGWLLHLPVRMLFTGHERMKGHGNRISRNVLSTLHTISPEVMERMIEARVDEGPGAIVHSLLWWAERLLPSRRSPEADEALSKLPLGNKAQLKHAWGDEFERRLAFGDRADHPLFDTEGNPKGFWLRGRGGNYLLVPSARVLLATLGRVEMEGEPGFHFPDYLNTLLQVIRMLDVKPERFEKAVKQLRENVLRAANAMVKAHSIRVPGLHGVLVAVKGLGEQVVVPNRFRRFHGTLHGEPCMHQDGIREASVSPLGFARDVGTNDPHLAYLLDHLVDDDFEVILADWDRLTRMNRDNDGDLIYLSHLPASRKSVSQMDRVAERMEPFVSSRDRFEDLTLSFAKLESTHDPFELTPEVVQKAVLETAASAKDIGAVTLWKYCVQEALAHHQQWRLLAIVARLAQQYIDGLKGPHATSANLFVALMRVWSRMAVPCLAVKDDKQAIVAVRLSPPLLRELVRARYVDGQDFHSEVEVPHPSLADEAFARIKRPLVEILEEILRDLEGRGLCTRRDAKHIRDVLEDEYGLYPRMTMADRDRVVRERRERYGAAQRLYAIRPLRSLADVEAMELRPTWKRLAELSVSVEPNPDRIESLAQAALEHDSRAEAIVEF